MKFRYLAIFIALLCAASALSLSTRDAFAAATTSIGQNGIVWTFNSSVTYGQFANGDYWVLAPVTITSVTPDFTGTLHGLQENPTVNGSQSLDSGVGSFNAGLAPALPYTVNATTSLVKVISRTVNRGTGGNGCEHASDSDRNCIKNASVLTVLGSLPLNDGINYFRPTFIGSSKQLLSTTSIDYGLLSSLSATAAASTYNHAWVISNFSGPYLDFYSAPSSQALHPKDYMPAYGGDFGVHTANAALALAVGSMDATKREAVNKYVQAGIDLYHQMSGTNWTHNGGHANGRFLPIVYAATLLNNSTMLTTLSTVPDVRFGESGALFWTEKPYGNGRKVLFGATPSGDAEFEYWKVVDTDSGFRTAKDPYGMIDGGTEPASPYQVTGNSMIWKGITLALRLIPESLETAPFIERLVRYSDRWVTVGAQAQPDTCAPFDGNIANYGITFGPNGSGGCIPDTNPADGTGRFPTKHGASQDSGGNQSDMVNQMWTSYSSTLGDLLPPLISNGAPTTTLASSVTSTVISVSTDEAATCKYSTSASASYAAMTVFSTTGGTSHSSTVTGLTPDTTYTYYVKCEDGSGNTTVENYSFSFNINNPYSLSDRLILHYTFDNANMIDLTTVDDLSASSSNGTFVNGVATTTGQVNQAASLDGINDYISTGGMLATTSVSVAVWTKNNSSSIVTRQGIVVRGNNTGTVSQARFGLYSQFGPAEFHAGNGGGVVTAQATIVDWSQWHYLVGTFDITTGTAKIYVDGVLANTSAASSTFGATLNNSIDTPKIGANGRTSSDYWAGLLDDVRVWDRAISASEVETLYSSMLPDATAPTVAITAPSASATISGVSVLTASSSDAVGVVGVQFKRGGNTLIGSEDTTSPYIATLDTTALSDGTYSLTAVSRDAAGNYATSSSVSVTVDNTAPVTSSLAVSTTTTTATVTWSTDEAARGQVEYGLTSSYTASTSIAIDASYITSHSVNVSGLSAATTYHYRIVSFDAAGNRRNGSDGTFTTAANLPTVTTQAASSISATSAVLNGNITATGGANPTVRGFAYGTVANLSTVIATTSSSGSFSTGAFTDTPTISCNTTYYFRPYATNSAGTSYGSIVSFTTSACPQSNEEEQVTTSQSFSGTSASRRQANMTNNQPKVSVNSSIPSLSSFIETLITLGVIPADKVSLARAAVSVTPAASKSSFTRDLQLHDRGEDVKALQNFLISKGYLPSGNNIGIFGPMTFSALKKYQASVGLPSTGYFGPRSRTMVSQ